MYNYARKVGVYDSQLEAHNADVLVRSKLPWGHEDGPCRIEYTLPIRGGHCKDCDGNSVVSKHIYTCDFWFTSKSGKTILVETKGGGYSWKGETRAKHQAIKKQYPEMDLRFVFSNKLSKISRASKTTNTDWCKRQGFLCESKLIPSRWLNE